MNRRADSAREKADLFFFAYYQYGPDRSIARLYSDLKTMGVRISESTLKRYSKEYGWQERIADLDAEARQQQNQRGVEDVLAMYKRHTQLARVLQGAGGSALKQLLANYSRLGNLKPNRIPGFQRSAFIFALLNETSFAEQVADASTVTLKWIPRTPANSSG